MFLLGLFSSFVETVYHWPETQSPLQSLSQLIAGFCPWDYRIRGLSAVPPSPSLQLSTTKASANGTPPPGFLLPLELAGTLSQRSSTAFRRSHVFLFISVSPVTVSSLVAGARMSYGSTTVQGTQVSASVACRHLRKLALIFFFTVTCHGAGEGPGKSLHTER